MEQKKLTLGSLFDGSGGFPLGGLLAGIQPVWASEVEPFPIRVTTKRLPFMKHYGDVSNMHGDEVEPVDIITFGSPCQDMSLAGKRAGLDGSRSNLFYEAVRIVKEMRCATNGQYPRWICWENVPGAFSSNDGADFKTVLDSICQIKDEELSVPEYKKWESAGEILGNDYSIAWRVLDAQFWGVPQRRKRIFLIADFAGRSAGQILFESEGLSGYTPQGFLTWQGVASCSSTGSGSPGIGFDGYNGCLTADTASTLGVNCGMSTGRNGVVLNDQGGNRIDISEKVTGTLRAEAHHPPCVMVTAGFCTEHSAKARSIGYEDEMSPTLRAGVVPATVYENNSQDARYKDLSDVAPTVSSMHGMGGNNQPFAGGNPKTLKIRSGCEGGGKGALIQDNKSATLGCNNDQTIFEPKILDTKNASDTSSATNASENPQATGKDNCNAVVGAYGICARESNSMKSENPKSGFYKANSSRCIDSNGGNPSCNQGDGVNEDVSFTLNATDRHAVYAMTTGEFTQVCENTAPTLLSRDYKDATVVSEPAYGIDRAAFNQGRNAQYKPSIEEEQQPTLTAKGPGAVAQPASFYPQMKAESQCFQQNGKSNTLVNGTNPGYQNGLVEPSYSVRRLTPTECARLQGFPDWWCSNLGTDNPSYGEIDFWSDVFDTHRKITGKSSKPKTRNQIIKWLIDPHSDAAEYKMWGNGVALPCVFFVLAGVAWAAKKMEK